MTDLDRLRRALDEEDVDALARALGGPVPPARIPDLDDAAEAPPGPAAPGDVIPLRPSPPRRRWPAFAALAAAAAALLVALPAWPPAGETPPPPPIEGPPGEIAPPAPPAVDPPNPPPTPDLQGPAPQPGEEAPPAPDPEIEPEKQLPPGPDPDPTPAAEPDPDPTPPAPTLRGDEGERQVSLQLVGQSGGSSKRIARGEAVAVGDTVWLVVRSRPAGAVRVWVEGPGGEVELGEIAAEEGASGSLAWRVDAAGPHRFYASASRKGSCERPSCDEWEIVAR